MEYEQLSKEELIANLKVVGAKLEVTQYELEKTKEFLRAEHTRLPGEEVRNAKVIAEKIILEALIDFQKLTGSTIVEITIMHTVIGDNRYPHIIRVDAKTNL